MGVLPKIRTCVVAGIFDLVIIAPASGSDDDFLAGLPAAEERRIPPLRRAGATGGALLATISRLDGCFGCDQCGGWLSQAVRRR